MTGTYTSETDLVDSISATLAPATIVEADVGQLHEHDVAEAVLGEVGDADRGPTLPSTRTHSCSRL